MLMGNIEEAKTEPQMTVDEALVRIELIKGTLSSLGANDYEFPRLDEIVKALKAAEITPQQAVKLAEAVLAGKNDYH